MIKLKSHHTYSSKIKAWMLTFIISFVFSFSAHALEPGNNLGKTISQLQSEFPNLRYSKSEAKGDLYIDNSDEGLPTFFWFKNGLSVEECLMIQDTTNFPLMWWRQMCDKFYNESSYKHVEPKAGHYKFFYSTFSIDLIYIEEGGINTAMIVYTEL